MEAPWLALALFVVLAAPAHAQQIVADVDPRTGSPRVLARLDGTLTPPAAGSPQAIATAYVRANLADWGLTEDDLDAPRVRALPGGITAVHWPQSVDGVPVADHELRVNVAADGRVLSVLGSPVSSLSLSTEPQVEPGEAVRVVQDDVGSHRPLVRSNAAERQAVYRDGTVASLVVFRGRLAWRVTYQEDAEAVHDAVVDARTGDVLQRENMVKFAAPALVWERFPGNLAGGTPVSVDLEASGWLPAGAANLTGPNAHAYSDVNDSNTAQASEEVGRVGGSFAFPLVSVTGSSCDAGHLCSWSGGTATDWQANRAQGTVQSFYFANRFHDHLRSLGFDAAAGAFEGVDRLELNTFDGASSGPDSAHINNASMYTPPDGFSPLMQMFLLRNPNYRNGNSGDDAAILYHEYTHGLSNRLVIDAGGVGALYSPQAGAMGEGWSDWYAQDFLVGQFPALDTAASGEVDMGEYWHYAGGGGRLRTEPIDCPTVAADPIRCPGRPVPGSGGYTYGDFGRIVGGPQVHADGEIWGQTLWDVRTAVGSARARTLVTAGMSITPLEPSMLDARNAILIADQALFGGADLATLWNVFAARGMGFFAAAIGGEDLAPVESFAVPPPANGPVGSIAGRVTDALTGAPVSGANVGVAGLGGLSATTAADGTYAIPNVPAGTYVKVLAIGPGHDQAVTSLSVPGGGTINFSPALQRNWASVYGGAVVTASNGTEYTGNSCGPVAAVDQWQATGWSTNNGTDKFLVVRLPAVVNVTQFALDPGETCADGANTATGAYRVETSPDGTNWTVAHSGTFGTSARHVLNLVTPTAGATGVRFARLWLLSAQGGSGAPFRDFSEFGVYGTAVGADTTPPETTLEAGGPPIFTFSSEAGATFECRLGVAAFAACTSPHNVGALPDGTYTFEVRARDAAGNVDPSPASRTFTIDTTPPNTTLESGGPPIFSFSSEAGATFECRVGAAAFARCTSPHNVGALADGTYTFEVRARDAAGNVDPTPASRTFTVDTTPPQTTLESGGPPVFAFSSEAGATFECRLGAAAFAACTSPHNVGALADGTYTFEVRARDAAGNVDLTPASRTFTNDTVAPETTLSASGPPLFTFSANESATFECRIVPAAFAGCTSPHNVGALADGTYTFEVRARDAAGNVDLTPASRTFTIDTVAPDTTIDSGPTGTINVTTPTFTFVASESGTFECRLGTDAFGPCTTPRILGPLVDGTYTFAVRAVDAAGNIDPTPATRTFTVETTTPDTVVLSGPTGATNLASPSFTFTSTKPNSTFECRLGTAAFAPCTSPHSVGPLIDGDYTLSVRARDASGNVDETPATRSFTVDTAAPQTTLEAGGPPVFTFSTEPGATFECRLNTAAFTACTSPHNVGALADGTYTFEVRARDAADNVDPTPASRTFTIDTTAPQTTLEAGGPPVFTFSSEAGATFECRLNAAAFTACTSPHNVGALADGTYTFEVRARDAAGNVDQTPASRTFTIDTVPPDTTITAGPTGPTANASPSFDFASEPGATFECRLGTTGAFEPCTSPRTVGPLTDGDYTFAVRARDAAGNIDPTPATRSFAVNTVAPQTTIETGPPEFTNDPTPTFTLASSTPDSTFACALDQAPSAPCTSPHTTEPLQDGPHTLAARATDPIGNADPTPATSAFTVDTVAPDTLIDEGPPATIHAGPTTFAIRATEQASLQCSLDAAPYGACTRTPNAEDLALGEHVYRARATDRAGNVDATPAEHRFAVTNLAPAATLTAQISGLTVTLAPAATDGDGDPLSYTLDFGDGESTQGTLPAAAGIEHRYAAQGIYTATLHVHDGRTTTTRTHELTLGLVQATARVELGLSAPAGLGRFTPGVTRDYTTTVTATIAGSGSLRVADLTGTATGHLVGPNGPLAQPLQANNHPLTTPLRIPSAAGTATIEFKQPIAATDVLRTGAYAKPLTFTLTPTGP